MVNFQLRTIIWGSVRSTVLLILLHVCFLFLQVLKGTEVSMVFRVKKENPVYLPQVNQVRNFCLKVSEYDQKIPQSHTEDQLMAS